MTAFADTSPDLETCWRSIILFGRNVAAFTFALAQSLTELGGHENAFIQPEDTSGFLSAFL